MPEIVDIFNQDAFSASALTGNITLVPNSYGRINELGLFRPEPITMRRKHAITLEHLRVTAMRGQIRDYDGSVLLDLFQAFGVTEKVVDFALGTSSTDVGAKCDEVVGYMEDNLLGETMTGVGALASPEWMAKFTSHASVKDAYKFFASAPNPMRESVRKGFPFKGIVFEEYRGAASYVQEDGTVSTPERFIPAGDVRFFPLGTSDTFTNYWAPPDFWSAVNQAPALDSAEVFVAPLEPKKFGKGMDIHTESNPLPLVKRPALLVRGTTSN